MQQQKHSKKRTANEEDVDMNAKPSGEEHKKSERKIKVAKRRIQGENPEKQLIDEDTGEPIEFEDVSDEDAQYMDE